MKYRPEMTQSLLLRFTTYDPETGILKRTHCMNRAHQIIECETVPTSVTAQGYRQLNMFKRPYLVHRLAFLYMTGRMPNEVDHINGDRLDNRWVNLRDVDSYRNKRNMGLCKLNKSGVPGVWYYERYGKWEVRIAHKGKSIYLGRYFDLDDAVAVRRKAETEFNYHENHGKRESWKK